MSKQDIVIRNGEIATTAGSAGFTDIGIAHGVISQIGGSLEGNLEIDAKGMLIF